MGEKTTPWTAADIPNLRGRTAIVTGASAGLGLETARMLAQRGARVVLACRNIQKAAAAAEFIRQTAPEAELPIVPLDLASLAAVRTAADKVRAEYDRIDLLINNAGTINQRRTVTEDGFESTIATNHLGPFAFTGLLLDLLLAAPQARVVTVSSGGSEDLKPTLDLGDLNYEGRKYQPLKVYGASKLANLLFTFELQRRLNGTDAELASLASHPGVARSDFADNMGPAIRFLHRPSMRWMTDWLLQSTEMGALPTLRAAVDPKARGGEFYGPSGKFRGHPELNRAGDAAHDPDSAARLWTESERLTGVSYRID
ncbi:oxidoreductase [Nocardia crassostreae]|uniref:oxidoreductase n=1 Tax=Nocardia crassostreae TaxID=53428 RepID=UPI0008366230|nr:oxidoreductase [Nocardia crassostreae]